MASDSNSDNSERIAIGRIPLKQVRVRRPEASANPMNRLVPYLDLFCRLDDEELARLAACDEDVVATLRRQVVTIDRALSRWVDLLPRLDDEELVRLTGATPKTIRFWRLCQPRVPEIPERDPPVEDGVVARAAKSKAVTAPQPAALRAEPSPAESFTRGVRPSDSQRLGLSTTDEHAADESGPYPTPALTQETAKRFMQFSGEPFPGFEEDTTPMPVGPAWTPATSEDVEIEAFTDELIDDPGRGV
jgi:hypothetical protein